METKILGYYYKMFWIFDISDFFFKSRLAQILYRCIKKCLFAKYNVQFLISKTYKLFY